MLYLNDTPIKPTKFPDNTHQVWQLPLDVLDKVYKNKTNVVVWEFESDAEFIQLAQLKTLLDTYTQTVELEMPYLPYGRQDKRVDNNQTFGLTTFARLLNYLNFTKVSVLDAHNYIRASMIHNLQDLSPYDFMRKAIVSLTPPPLTILFPDAGAKERYKDYFTFEKKVFATKVRDQATGAIKGVTISDPVKDARILIVDDICDGGATFIALAKQAYADGATEVHLYVTHGIFSKGLEVLRDAGIQRVFTYKGEQPRVTVPVYDGGH